MALEQLGASSGTPLDGLCLSTQEAEDVSGKARGFGPKRVRHMVRLARRRLLDGSTARWWAGLGLLVVVCVTFLYQLSWTEADVKRKNEELQRAYVRAQQVRVYVSGEPTFDENTADDSMVDFNLYDLLLLSGGANLRPSKSFWFAELLRPFTNILRDSRELYAPISERVYADVMFRSSMCDKQREDLVAAVRSRVEAAGFTFKQEGKCGGTGYPARVNRAWNREIDRWAFCEECKKSKIVVAFERHTNVHNYLGEKLFLGFEYGAVPAYSGNGHPWIDLMGVNTDAFLDRKNYASDGEFGDAIVKILQNPRKLQAMQEMHVFNNVSFAREMVRMYVEPLTLGSQAYPALHERIMTIPKLRRLYGRKVVTFSTTSGDPFNVQNIIKALFNAKYAVRFQRDDEEDADVLVYRCC